jgi:hypothetical protein
MPQEPPDSTVSNHSPLSPDDTDLPGLDANEFHEGEPLQKSRADLVFILGILSLLCCWPLGLVTWLMGRSDLKQIHAGKLSTEGMGTLRAGMIMGIIGLVLFIVSLLSSVLVGFRLPGSLERLASQMQSSVEETIKTTPLSEEQMAYAGEWVSDEGASLRIYPNGRADYRHEEDGLTNRVEGASLTIQDGTLSVKMLVFEKTWTIDEAPSEGPDGQWTMTLDGELFTKTSEALDPLPQDEEPELTVQVAPHGSASDSYAG